MIALRVGAAYFAIVFAAGFALGTIRVLVLEPAVGETAAVLIELPVMLTISWFACGWLIRRFAVAQDLNTRIAMGGIAFVLLMAAEFTLADVALGLPPNAYLAQFATLPGLMGLAGQIAFGVIPAVRRN
ncbi:hypothetical protein [Oricola thermophila]|uniref:Uncharacterized protein n=1 Tax=Oricola thermophila TaxID=2742145 RepID=A0A6N1VAF1_9HYPH|nr:hypothetical protein [Oricola thermophila]QKV17971.1 hypothetical protein HTY61_05600 [Oricola thermophila]